VLGRPALPPAELRQLGKQRGAIFKEKALGKEGVLTLVFSYYETENWLLLVTVRNGACPQGRKKQKKKPGDVPPALSAAAELRSLLGSSALIRTIQHELTVTIRAQERTRQAEE